jgi:hypothetical protein
MLKSIHHGASKPNNAGLTAHCAHRLNDLNTVEDRQVRLVAMVITTHSNMDMAVSAIDNTQVKLILSGSLCHLQQCRDALPDLPTQRLISRVVSSSQTVDLARSSLNRFIESQAHARYSYKTGFQSS